MSDKEFGWGLTVTSTPPGGIVPSVDIWYAACPNKDVALATVIKAVHTPGATVEINREMSYTVMTGLGLKSGEAKCFG